MSYETTVDWSDYAPSPKDLGEAARWNSMKNLKVKTWIKEATGKVRAGPIKSGSTSQTFTFESRSDQSDFGDFLETL
jgi:hypothetical protein